MSNQVRTLTALLSILIRVSVTCTDFLLCSPTFSFGQQLLTPCVFTASSTTYQPSSSITLIYPLVLKALFRATHGKVRQAIGGKGEGGQVTLICKSASAVSQHQVSCYFSVNQCNCFVLFLTLSDQLLFFCFN